MLRWLLVGAVVLAAVVSVVVGLVTTPPARPTAGATPVAAAPRAPAADAAPPAVQARLDEVVAARPLRFVEDSTAMVPNGPQTIDGVAWILLTSPRTTVTLTGHTAFAEGDPLWCQRLSELRADQVARRLESYGVSPERMRTQGWSHHQPAESVPASRRVEVTVA